MFKRCSALIKIASLLLALSTVMVADPKSLWGVGEPKLPNNLID